MKFPILIVLVLLTGYSFSQTLVSIKGNEFYINGKPTYEGRYWKGNKIQGLLMNSRMVQGIFDDLSPEPQPEFAYPDTKQWDADRNNKAFIAAMPEWKAKGLCAFTLNLQGGSPYGYGNKKAVNPCFNPDGTLIPAYIKRLEGILKKADELRMVVVLGLFYFGQDQYLTDEKAVIAAVNNVVSYIKSRGYKHVLIEINNECDHKDYDHDILRPQRVHELIDLVKKNTIGGYNLLASTSFTGRKVPSSNVVKSSDFILIHGNGAKNPSQIQLLIDSTKRVDGFRNVPIVNNEDDHFNFDRDTSNLAVSVRNYVSWGYFDYRFKGETDINEGYQTIPVNWGIGSSRKREFFNKIAEITGSAPSEKGNHGLSKKDYIKIEAERIGSGLGDWVILKPGDPNYIIDASGDKHIEFLGNNPDMGKPNSPLSYTFKAPKDGNFRLLIMASKRLEGVRGDMCNDAYVKMSGPFETACNLDKITLENYIKYFQEGSVKTPEKSWHWGIRGERDKHEFFNLVYACKKGEKYTITVAGRSQRFSIDYLVLYDNDKVTLKEAQAFFSK